MCACSIYLFIGVIFPWKTYSHHLDVSFHPQNFANRMWCGWVHVRWFSKHLFIYKLDDVVKYARKESYLIMKFFELQTQDIPYSLQSMFVWDTLDPFKTKDESISSLRHPCVLSHMPACVDLQCKDTDTEQNTSDN